MLEKFVPQKNDSLICSNSGWGPTFGNFDIWISNSCNVEEAQSDFPKDYNRKDKNRQLDEDSRQLFSGSKGNKFKIEEY